MGKWLCEAKAPMPNVLLVSIAFGSQIYAAQPLLLDGLEIFNEDEEIAADHFLADRTAPDHLSKALTPYRHLPTAMGRNDAPPVNKGGNLRGGEVPPTPLGNAREIRWGGMERWRGWPIPPAFSTMAGATVPDKILAPHPHRLSWTQRWLRRC